MDEKHASTMGGAGLGGKGYGKNKAGFMQKLYEDEDEIDELKVFGGLDEDDEQLKDAQDEKQKLMKRKEKALSKLSDNKKSVAQKNEISKTKIPKLSLKKGSIALFAICEVAKDHLIVNHTRNMKGYINLKNTPFEGKGNKFKLG